MPDIALSLIASFCVVSGAVAVASMWVALRKAPPESNEQLALKVSKMQIELEDVFDALERWGKRTAVRESRARKQNELVEPVEMQAAAPPTITGSRTGIMRGQSHVRTQSAGS